MGVRTGNEVEKSVSSPGSDPEIPTYHLPSKRSREYPPAVNSLAVTATRGRGTRQERNTVLHSRGPPGPPWLAARLQTRAQGAAEPRSLPSIEVTTSSPLERPRSVSLAKIRSRSLSPPFSTEQRPVRGSGSRSWRARKRLTTSRWWMNKTLRVESSTRRVDRDGLSCGNQARGSKASRDNGAQNTVSSASKPSLPPLHALASNEGLPAPYKRQADDEHRLRSPSWSSHPITSFSFVHLPGNIHYKQGSSTASNAKDIKAIPVYCLLLLIAATNPVIDVPLAPHRTSPTTLRGRTRKACAWESNVGRGQRRGPAPTSPPNPADPARLTIRSGWFCIVAQSSSV
ncbi:hypothetical protein MAPG_08606 [Magnaporthiopsis poae ATCC 64411]|uniref:Uncharacterized protein n=1 Tax=Magnaporthiopsis poae (strain ATCC 64411 / 73-15) TaxID=644358 RepID=A0A0C4E7T4_MAGP6|nr:hypothetical protein MAPG_08606 [Magnaporthiopsis poae ATCC 64411]